MEVFTRYYGLPSSIRSYVVSNADGTYTVVLNSCLTREQNIISYQHELEHIKNGDYEKKCDVDIIEFYAHAN